jgi:GNAT superfamily N-acetyltransferase
MVGMDELLRRWERGWGLCRGLPGPTERGDGAAALEVVLGLPGREREVFALGDEAELVSNLAAEVAGAPVPVWLTVTTQQPDEAAKLLEYAGLNLFDEWKLLMSIELRNHPDATAPAEYRLETVSDGVLEYARVIDADGNLAARGMMAVVGADAVMHDIHTDPAHRRRGLGSVVMALLSRRAVERGATTGLLMATTEGAYLYGELGWLTEATMLTATTPERAAA